MKQRVSVVNQATKRLLSQGREAAPTRAAAHEMRNAPKAKCWNSSGNREEQSVDEHALHTAGRRAPGLCATRSGHGVRRAFSLHSEKSQRILTVERSVACVLCATRDRGVKACSMEPTARSGGRRARYAQRRGRALASRPCAERVRRRSAPPGFRCCSNTLPLGRCASRGLPRAPPPPGTAGAAASHCEVVGFSLAS